MSQAMLQRRILSRWLHRRLPRSMEIFLAAPRVLALLVGLAGCSAHAFRCNEGQVLFWPRDGVIAPGGFLFIEGQGSWRREVEHMPISRLEFVSRKGTRVGAKAQLVSRPGALYAQVIVKAERNLESGLKYRLFVEADPSCLPAPRAGFLPKTLSTNDAEWIVQARSVKNPVVTQVVGAGLVPCLTEPCRSRAIEIALNKRGRSEPQLFLIELSRPSAQSPEGVVGVIASGDRLRISEDQCHRGLLYSWEGEACLRVARVSSDGTVSPWSQPQCLQERLTSPLAAPLPSDDGDKNNSFPSSDGGVESQCCSMDPTGPGMDESRPDGSGASSSDLAVWRARNLSGPHRYGDAPPRDIDDAGRADCAQRVRGGLEDLQALAKCHTDNDCRKFRQDPDSAGLCSRLEAISRSAGCRIKLSNCPIDGTAVCKDGLCVKARIPNARRAWRLFLTEEHFDPRMSCERMGLLPDGGADIEACPGNR